jgi:hypothetical protein
MKTKEQERETIRDNVSLAYVNGHVTHQQAGQALVALDEHWQELDSPAASAQRQGAA